MTQIVVYDANVLYPSVLRDILIRVGLVGLVQPKWTEGILDEVFNNLASDRPDLDPAKLLITRTRMNAAIRDVLVDDYESYIELITLPDENDCHVLAAAIKSEASIIVTKNLRDFPAAEMSKWKVNAKHPDCFLSELFASCPTLVLAALEDMALAWQSSTESAASVAKRMKLETPNFTEAALSYLSSQT